jgi:hypothetical protein
VLADAVDKLKRKVTQLQDRESESVLKPVEDKRDLLSMQSIASETIIVEVQVSNCFSFAHL